MDRQSQKDSPCLYNFTAQEKDVEVFHRVTDNVYLLMAKIGENQSHYDSSYRYLKNILSKIVEIFQWRTNPTTDINNGTLKKYCLCFLSLSL